MATILTLSEYIRDLGRKPFRWGICDCCLGPSDWMLSRRGVDPAAPLRGRYSTALGAARHIAKRGGFLPMVQALMAEAGFVPTLSPVPGDVGVVRGDCGLALAVRTSLGWAVKTENGVVVAPFDYVKAWSV